MLQDFDIPGLAVYLILHFFIEQCFDFFLQCAVRFFVSSSSIGMFIVSSAENPRCASTEGLT
jgi:hypothetical protein